MKNKKLKVDLKYKPEGYTIEEWSKELKEVIDSSIDNKFRVGATCKQRGFIFYDIFTELCNDPKCSFCRALESGMDELTND